MDFTFSEELKLRIPLFQVLPKGIYLQLDLSGFVLPTGELVDIRNSLEEKLNHYVVSCNKNIFNLDVPAERHLCALVGGAKLNKEQLRLLRHYERLAQGLDATFVVYQKPLELIPIKTSALFKEYMRRGII